MNADHGAPVHPARVLFVTGRLAEPALRRVLTEMTPPFAWDIAVLNITVAALMTTAWIGRHLRVPEGVDLILIPGLSEGDPHVIQDQCGVAVARGPDDLREIPAYFGRGDGSSQYGAWDIEIVAEINNAPRMSREAVRHEAEYFRASGANIIDIGCTPGLPFPWLGDIVRELVDAGMRVSIDTVDADEIRAGVAAGATLVLSVNSANLDVVRQVGDARPRWVAIPDLGGGLDTLAPTVATLEGWGASYLIDPILEPIGMGFMASLERFAEARRRWPQAEMLMGIGNLTELTAADSTGVNAMLVGICQELGVRAVLTTEVISWARGAVREVDVARRLMHYAVTGRTVPKGIDDRLVTVKDPEVLTYSEAELRRLQAAITDPNYRIFADREAITVFNRDRFVRGSEIQAIFDQLGVDDPAHAFYLGKELAKASTALALGKTYRQEGPLSWGYLTADEHRSTGRVRLTHSERRRDGRRA